MIVEVFSPYLQGRIMATILGKIRVPATKNKLLDQKCITQKPENRFEVQSSSDYNTKYMVDVSIGSCSCPNGMRNAMCKHHFSVLVHYCLHSPALSRATAEEKQFWTKIALGSNSIPGAEFFEDITNRLESNPSTPLNPPEEISATVQPSFIQESQSGVDIVPDSNLNSFSLTNENVNSSAGVDTSGETDPLSTSRQSADLPNNEPTTHQLYGEVVCLLDKYIEYDTQDANAALLHMKSKLEKVKSSAQLYAMMHNFGSTRACSSSGRKIHVQPTAIARRQRGCPRGVAPLGKGRKPKSLAGKAKKGSVT